MNARKESNVPKSLVIFIASLASLTQATRDHAALEGAEILQAWAWRGGELAVCRIWAAWGGRDYTFVLVRQGLRTGAVRRIEAESCASALAALGIGFRIGARRPRPPRTARECQRAAIARAARRAGNMFRTVRASSGLRLDQAVA